MQLGDVQRQAYHKKKTYQNICDLFRVCASMYSFERRDKKYPMPCQLCKSLLLIGCIRLGNKGIHVHNVKQYTIQTKQSAFVLSSSVSLCCISCVQKLLNKLIALSECVTTKILRNTFMIALFLFSECIITTKHYKTKSLFAVCPYECLDLQTIF